MTEKENAKKMNREEKQIAGSYNLQSVFESSKEFANICSIKELKANTIY